MTNKGRALGKTTRFAGDFVSVGGGAWVAHYVQLPHGLPASSFLYACAPIAALAGYEVGQLLSRRIDTRRAIIGAVLSLVIVPATFYLYYALLSVANPGLESAALIYLSFSSIFFALFCSYGLLHVQIFARR